MNSIFHIQPIDNCSEYEGVAVFTKFYLIETSTGNAFPAQTDGSGEKRYYTARVTLDRYKQEIVIGEMGSCTSLENSMRDAKLLFFDFNKEWQGVVNIMKSLGDWNGFTFEEEPHIGSVFLSRDNLAIYCSPFWEYDPEVDELNADEIGINIDISDEDGASKENYIIPCAYPTNKKEFEVFKEFYITEVNKLSKKFG